MEKLIIKKLETTGKKDGGHLTFRTTKATMAKIAELANATNRKVGSLVDMLVTSEATRYIRMGAWNGNIEDNVEMYNGAKILPVPSGRWPNANVNFIFVNKAAVTCVTKFNAAEFYEKVPGYVGSQIDYAMYHDFFVLKNKNVGIYVEWEKPEAPVFDPVMGASDTFTTSMTLKLSSITPGAKIYYTNDGSTSPTASSTEYTSAGIALSATKTIKAVAVLNAVLSDVVTQTCTKA